MRFSKKYLPWRLYIEIGKGKKGRYNVKHWVPFNRVSTAHVLYNGYNMRYGYKKRLISVDGDFKITVLRQFQS